MRFALKREGAELEGAAKFAQRKGWLRKSVDAGDGGLTVSENSRAWVYLWFLFRDGVGFFESVGGSIDWEEALITTRNFAQIFGSARFSFQKTCIVLGQGMALHVTLRPYEFGRLMGSTAIAPAEERLDQPSVGERRALIDRIAASEQFRRSARLRDFLLYVGGQSLKDGCPEIHEQEIGAKVFGRPPAYDRSQDNIVRVAATDLRKRLELYFASEGAHETLILEIPRGGYKPVFRRRSPESSSALQLPTEIVPGKDAGPDHAAAATLPDRRHYLVHVAWATVSLLLLVVCFLLFQQTRSMQKLIYTWEDKPAVSALWKDFVKPSQQTDIVLPDASLSIREELTGYPTSLTDYINRQYMNEPASHPVSSDRREDLSDIYGHNLVAFGDFRAAQQILALSPVGSSLHLTLSRFFQAESVKHDNLILIGGKKANPWIYLFDDQMTFSLDYDDAKGLCYIANRHPRAGEASSYTPSLYPSGFVGYSVVAYLPNPSHSGNVIILTGTDSDATSAAAEFLTSEVQLKKFQNTLHAQKFPYFEVLLKTSRLSGTSFSSEILAYRTYPTLE